MKQPVPAPRSRRPIRRILVVATRQIGDVLLTTPLIREARRLWPEATIDVLGFVGTLGMLAGNPDVAELIEVPASGGAAASFRFARALWRRYDLALVTQHSDRAHSPRLRRRAAARRPRRAEAAARLVEAAAAGTRGNHRRRSRARARGTREAEPARPLAFRAIGEPEPPSDPGVVATPAVPLPVDIEALLANTFVVVQVPSMWRYKAWPLPHYRELVAALLDDGVQVLLTGGPSADDRRAVAAVAALAPPPRLLDVAGRLGFGQLAHLLGRAALYIGPDTSVTHLAAASAVPVVALFGPTSPMRWGPLDPAVAASAPYAMRSASDQPQRRGRVVLLQGDAACVPCTRAGCEDHRQSRSDCLETMAPARVIAAARAALGDRITLA